MQIELSVKENEQRLSANQMQEPFISTITHVPLVQITNGNVPSLIEKRIVEANTPNPITMIGSEAVGFGIYCPLTIYINATMLRSPSEFNNQFIKLLVILY